MSSNELETIQYKPFMSFVHPSFWHALTELKLDVDKLNDTTKEIHGRFTFREDIGTVFEVDSTSFNRTPDSEHFHVNVTGTIMNKNTIEDFKSIDKAAFLNSVGEIIWASIKKKEWIEKPSSLLNFFILCFADLKKFHYYYWFAFPAPSQPVVHITEKSACITTHFSNKQLEELLETYKSLDMAQKCFFTATKKNDSIIIDTLSKVFNSNKIRQTEIGLDLSNTYFVFTDPSDASNPGWPLRLFLAAILEHCPFLAGAEVNAIGLRCKMTGGLEGSLIFKVKLPMHYDTILKVMNYIYVVGEGSEQRELEVFGGGLCPAVGRDRECTPDSGGWVGWERNEKGNFGPRLANMAASMDPVKLADTSSDLNIRLMKWRLVPDIDTDVMKKTKCLLLGAGTLGCHVARDLLAWGFRHITFIDNGKVSYSNPTRQVLFSYYDCLNGGRKKAEAAADNLKNILPTAVSNGIVAHIPMPGHPIGESLKEETLSHIQIITEAIANHDVIFLLLDTREARWLPTLIAAHYGKIVINAALGFDTYLVMRHGDGSASTDNSIDKESISGGQLGCYFCNDVTAPGNSLKDRTLDQQCTVTRPGVAAIAGALAVEILVGLLQHPLGIQAPAAYNISESDIPAHLQGVLGPIPHSIRGFLHSYQSVTPTCAKFKQCIACSDIVVNKYRTEGTEFLLNVFNSGNYLEEITGLTALHLAAEMTDIMTFSDDDEE